ncbi:MAG: hypothetical protein QM737_18250 [Ferruginibacter sp.]
MKATKKILAGLLLSIFFIGCSKKDSSPASGVAPTVTTADATNINGLSVTLTCVINSAGSSTIFNHGVCWGTSHNPTIADSKAGAGSTDIGSHVFNVTVAAANATYYARAYAENDAGLTYGNEISFNTSYGIISMPVEQITTVTALFKGNTVSSPNYTVGLRGYCYSTSPNPNSSNSIAGAATTGFGDFTAAATNLTPNTTYYARSLYYVQSEVFYGEEITFKTAGYSGPAGGYVAYDKGVVTDGWRYLEIYPISQDYNASGTQWGCNGTFISNTNTGIGTGLANTTRIVSNCGNANCAARICDNFSQGGYSDWFLGSKDEMQLIGNSLDAISIQIETCWTSSESLANDAWEIPLANNYVPIIISKTINRDTYPVRRY